MRGRYVSEIDEGLKLTTLALRFAKRSLRREWKGKIGVNVAEVFEVASGELTRLSAELRETTHISVSFMQQEARQKQRSRLFLMLGLLNVARSTEGLSRCI